MIVSYPTVYCHHETKEKYKYEIIQNEIGVITPEITKFFDDNNIKRLKDKDKDTKTKL